MHQAKRVASKRVLASSRPDGQENRSWEHPECPLIWEWGLLKSGWLVWFPVVWLLASAGDGNRRCRGEDTSPHAFCLLYLTFKWLELWRLALLRATPFLSRRCTAFAWRSHSQSHNQRCPLSRMFQQCLWQILFFCTLLVSSRMHFIAVLGTRRHKVKLASWVVLLGPAQPFLAVFGSKVWQPVHTPQSQSERQVYRQLARASEF